MSNILTPLEVIRLAPLTKDFPPMDICNLIELEEYAWFDTCDLGLDFYEALKQDLTPLPQNVREWSTAGTYAENSYVTFYTQVLRSKINNNKVNPISDDGASWELVPKFQTPCVNNIWRSVSLALSYFIIAQHLVEISYKIGGKGTTKYSDEFKQNVSGVVSIERGERFDLQQSLQNNADRFYKTMVRIIEKSDCSIAPTAKINQDTCAEGTCPPRRTSRRIMYRR